MHVQLKVEKELIYSIALMLLAVANEVYSLDYPRKIESKLSRYTADIQKSYKALHRIIE